MLTGAPPPPLTAEEAAQRERMAAALRSRIDAGGGWIPFREFMETALYAPGLGYYVTPRAVFGAAGDFVTAPELSPLFAACLANGVADLLAKSGGGDVVEFGAGSGALAAGLWPALQRLGAPVARYRIVEPSPALAARQRERIAAGSGARALARPVRVARGSRRRKRGGASRSRTKSSMRCRSIASACAPGGCEALGVVVAGEGFAFAPRAADAALAAAVESLQRALPAPMPAGYVSELRPGQRDWLAASARTLACGAMLIVDYGLPRAQYYHASRDGGTLCGFRRHRRDRGPARRPGTPGPHRLGGLLGARGRRRRLRARARRLRDPGALPARRRHRARTRATVASRRAQRRGARSARTPRRCCCRARWASASR